MAPHMQQGHQHKVSMYNYSYHGINISTSFIHLVLYLYRNNMSRFTSLCCNLIGPSPLELGFGIMYAAYMC